MSRTARRHSARYYDDQFSSVAAQKANEKAIFRKVHRLNTDLIVHDGSVVLYRNYLDVIFILTGAPGENELLLQAVLCVARALAAIPARAASRAAAAARRWRSGVRGERPARFCSAEAR